MISTDPTHEPQRGSRLAGLVMLLVLLVAVGSAAWVLYGQWQSASDTAVDRSRANPALSTVQRLSLELFLARHAAELDGPAGEARAPGPFSINPGESAAAIAANLAEQGFVRNRDLFLNFLIYYGYDGALVAGSHTLDPAGTIAEMADTLSGGGPRALELSFLPGWRVEEMANYLSVVSPARIDPAEFLDIVKRRRPIDLSGHAFLAALPPDASLEGYLYPGAYPITTDTDSAELVELMLTEFGRQLTPELRQLIGAQGLSVRDALILASIVQREALLPEEKPVMAGVFLNRLRAGMPLQADPTVQYALGYQPETGSWWKSPLSLADLEVDSPFNTYRIDGLPPAPIANPARVSLEAVANPAVTDFLFFVLDCTAAQPGTHIFSVTFEEHLANVARCR
jgi:UPF0755 protein